MTYRLHSDIVWTYGETIDLSTGAVVAPNVYVQWKKVDDDFKGLFLGLFPITNHSLFSKQMTNS
jgi:hypothetical protein